MSREKFQPPSTTERGLRIALIFALVAERLTIHYEHGQWLTQGQGATLAADWLSRSKRVFPLAERRQLSDLSEQVARQISCTVSREAGLYIAHELTESLDPNYPSEIGPAIMAECERVFGEAAGL
ncbi:MAG: hypothetical protein WBH99_07110 [Azovibrio sp.]|uniref:hypothetical protein n=1 Tax=Azovibrio sp. TaxID=1872673 RepID=UPI003C70EFF1